MLIHAKPITVIYILGNETTFDSHERDSDTDSDIHAETDTAATYRFLQSTATYIEYNHMCYFFYFRPLNNTNLNQ